MYEHHFGLHRKPFQPVLTEGDFFESETHREIIPAILHALKSDLGVAVLTGPSGCGKTVTAEFLCRSLQTDSHTVFLRGGAVRSAAALLHSLHRSLKNANSIDETDLPASVANSVRRWDIIECLQRACDFWGPIVVLLDDAHLVESEVFAELRALLEEEAGGRKLLRLLITGPLSLEETLAEPTMADFAQRIRTHVFLQPLRSDESVRYLDLQIRNSGGVLGDIFEPEAIERITAAADGSPRCLGLLADECLVICDEHASREQNPNSAQDGGARVSADALNVRVSAAVVKSALQRLQHLPYAWNASALVEDEEDDHLESSVAELPSETSRSDSVTSSNGVIEIGGPGESAPLESSNSSDSSGVVEIGFQAPPREAVVVETAVETVTETDANIVETGQAATDPSLLSLTCDHDEAELSETNDAPAGAIEIDAVEFFDRTSEYPEFESEVSPHTSLDDILALGAAFAAGEPPDSTTSHDTDVFGVMPVEAIDGTQTAFGERDVEVPSSSASLEHHLVLAGGERSPEEDDSELDAEDATVQAASSLPVELTETVDASLGRYSRWEPAGAWPAPLIASVVESSSQTRLANATPVFDRYTWCELGRPVEPEQIQRKRLIEVSQTPVWPPDITGVAPVFSIPITDMDEPTTAFPLESWPGLPDTSDVATADFDSEAPLPELDADHPDESIDYIQQMLVQIGPVELLQSRRSDDPASEVAEDVQEDSEGWIDGQLVNEFRTIEQLLDSEAQIDDVCVNVARGIVDSEPTVELPVDEPDSAHAAQQVLDFVNDETNECAEQVLLPISGCTAATPACLDQKEDHDSGSNSAVHLEGPRLSALPIEIDDVDLIVRPTVSADASTSADITSVDSPPTISADRASVSDGPPGGTVFTSRQADPLPGNVQRLVEDTNETARIGSREDGYAPHLLQQARDRVVSIVPSREMLRPAAGAESIALPLPEPLHDADTRKKQGVRSLPRLSTICDLAGAEHEDGEPKDAGQSAEPRFARLFTRLRQQRAAGS